MKGNNGNNVRDFGAVVSFLKKQYILDENTTCKNFSELQNTLKTEGTTKEQLNGILQNVKGYKDLFDKSQKNDELAPHYKKAIKAVSYYNDGLTSLNAISDVQNVLKNLVVGKEAPTLSDEQKARPVKKQADAAVAPAAEARTVSLKDKKTPKLSDKLSKQEITEARNKVHENAKTRREAEQKARAEKEAAEKAKANTDIESPKTPVHARTEPMRRKFGMKDKTPVRKYETVSPAQLVGKNRTRDVGVKDAEHSDRRSLNDGTNRVLITQAGTNTKMGFLLQAIPILKEHGILPKETKAEIEALEAIQADFKSRIREELKGNNGTAPSLKQKMQNILKDCPTKEKAAIAHMIEIITGIESKLLTGIESVHGAKSVSMHNLHTQREGKQSPASNEHAKAMSRDYRKEVRDLTQAVQVRKIPLRLKLCDLANAVKGNGENLSDITIKEFIPQLQNCGVTAENISGLLDEFKKTNQTASDILQQKFIEHDPKSKTPADLLSAAVKKAELGKSNGGKSL